MYSDFIFQGYYLHGEGKHLKPVRLDFYGEKVSKSSGKVALSNYIYPSIQPEVDSKYCSKLVGNFKKYEIDIVVLARNQQNMFPPQNCDELYKDYEIVLEHSDGVIVARSTSGVK